MHSPVPPRAGRYFALGILLASATSLSAQSLSALKDYNVITIGDFSTNSDVEGRTLVGGNFTGSNSSTLGMKLQGKVSSTDKVLSVRGNISSGNPINLNAGSVEVGGSILGNRKINYNGGGSLLNGYTTNFTAIVQSLEQASALLEGYGANSTVIIPAAQPAAYKFNANPDSNGLAVFSITGEGLFGNNKAQQIEMNANGASSIIINVSGTNIVWNAGNIVGDLTKDALRDNVVWNFYEATSINFGAHNMHGDILAPLAHITSQGPIDGSVFAKSITTTGEMHLIVPEPSSALLGMLGAGLLLGRRKRNA